MTILNDPPDKPMPILPDDPFGKPRIIIGGKPPALTKKEEDAERQELMARLDEEIESHRFEITGETAEILPFPNKREPD